jgi:hypothetical protein
MGLCSILPQAYQPEDRDIWLQERPGSPDLWSRHDTERLRFQQT